MGYYPDHYKEIHIVSKDGDEVTHPRVREIVVDDIKLTLIVLIQEGNEWKEYTAVYILSYMAKYEIRPYAKIEKE